jgi:hypothetical protein
LNKKEDFMSLEHLKEAIQKRCKVSFEYNKPGKTPGERIGDPHAVFIMRRKDGSESTKVHIVQTAGVSDSGQELPSFRMFDLLEITSVQLVSPLETFSIDSGYNPEWEGYKFVIAKV